MINPTAMIVARARVRVRWNGKKEIFLAWLMRKGCELIDERGVFGNAVARKR